MVEVYSTNVKDCKQADFLLTQLGIRFPTYEINFDLEDCDNILRVESVLDMIDVFQVIALLNESGFTAEVLSDTLPSSMESILIDILDNLTKDNITKLQL